MRVDIWSDIVCPWCYVGKRRFERALAAFEHRDAVEIEFRAFQLNPVAAVGVTQPRRDMLKRKYGLSDDQVQTIDERMERIAAEEGLDYDLEGSLAGNTRGAHQLVHLAKTRGRADAMIERLYQAYFTEQRSIFDSESLVALAGDAGLEPNEARRVLRGNLYADEVAADGHRAAALGATGVPFFVLDGRSVVSGAQPVEVFAGALARAWTEAHQPTSCLTPRQSATLFAASNRRHRRSG